MPDSDNGSNGTQKQDGQQYDNLSVSLQPCGGVLKPPPTGDKNAAQPPDDGSQMPVIKPGQVPPQTSNKQFQEKCETVFRLELRQTKS